MSLGTGAFYSRARRLPRRRPPLVDDNTGDYFYYALKITTDSSDNSDFVRAAAWSSVSQWVRKLFQIKSCYVEVNATGKSKFASAN